MTIYNKKESVGAFLKKGEDFKGDDVIEIASEGQQIEGKFGMQDIFTIKTVMGKEGNVSFNTTSINALIDAFGKESKKWIGKKAKVWGIMSNVQGKMIKVYYFTGPNAKLSEDGSFTMGEDEVDISEGDVLADDLPHELPEIDS